MICRDNHSHLILIGFIITTAILVRSDCPRLIAPSYGLVVGACSPATESRCWIRCNNNDTLYTRQCKRDGTWSGEQLICPESSTSRNSYRECHPLQAPQNGYFNGQCTYNHGATCRVTCTSGFKLHGQSRLTCSRGRWSSSLPTCRQSSSKWSPVGQSSSYGSSVSNTNNYGSNNPSYGSNSVNYGNSNYQNYNQGSSQSSNTNYGSNNSSYYQGSSNSNSNGNNYGSNNRQSCPQVQVSGNTVTSGSCHNGAPVYSRCFVQCSMDDDYRPAHATLTCLPGGRWSGQAPRCKRQTAGLRQCIGLTPPVNGIYYGNCNPGFPNQACSFACNRGFFLVGIPILTCLSTGQWSASAPICHRGTGCRLPRIPSNVVITSCNSLVGGRCYYQCARRNSRGIGYNSRGNSTSSHSRNRNRTFWNLWPFGRRRNSTTTTTTTTTPSTAAISGTEGVGATGSGQVRYSECRRNGLWSRSFRCTNPRSSLWG
ncbi:P-selectin-like isoform X3 [Brevipalpus obovatus]|uniref:P-selectin-like isoform X3 n=1 Tax=Brevipalpus obovatus TaxID=246614 RepID=UPI003D9F5A79